jgi:hypothetical protein
MSSCCLPALPAGPAGLLRPDAWHMFGWRAPLVHWVQAQPLQALAACSCGACTQQAWALRHGAWALSAAADPAAGLLAHALLLTWAPLCAGSRGARGHDARPNA